MNLFLFIIYILFPHFILSIILPLYFVLLSYFMYILTFKVIWLSNMFGSKRHLMKVVTVAYLMKVVTVTYLMEVVTVTYLMKVVTETCRVH